MSSMRLALVILLFIVAVGVHAALAETQAGQVEADTVEQPASTVADDRTEELELLKLQLLSNDDLVVRTKAAKELAGIADSSSEHTFINAIKDQQQIKFYVVTALHRLGWQIESLGYFAFRFRKSPADEWIASERAPGIGWNGNRPLRTDSAILSARIDDVSVFGSSVSVKVCITNDSKNSREFDLCNMKYGIVRGLKFWSNGLQQFQITPTAEAVCEKGRCLASFEQPFGLPPHRFTELQPGQSMLISVRLTRRQYRIKRHDGVQGQNGRVIFMYPRVVTCIPDGEYFLTGCIGLNSGLLIRFENPIMIDVEQNCSG